MSTHETQDPGRILIVGAGPTGLGAAYRLRQIGLTDFALIEASDNVGGLARSYTDENGFTWDVGGHVLFSHYEEYDRIFEELMQGQYTTNERESWVRIAGTWVPYPFQNNLRYLPEADAKACIDGLIEAQTNSAGAAGASNFGEFIDNVFGSGIAQQFMRPYNFKVWACAPEKMNKTWIGERVAVLDWKRAKRNMDEGLDDFGWGPNNTFKYPLGGTGDFYDRFTPLLSDQLQLHTKLVSIDTAARTATFDHQGQLRAEPYDAIGVGIKRPCPSTKCWMYFPESDSPFYRVTYLSNYSPRMTPDPERYYSLLCETSFSEDKPEDEATILERTIAGLESSGLLQPGERDDIVSTWVMKVNYSYPTPSVERDELLATLIPWLEERGIFSRGRFGMWKYEVANTDHSVMQGVELIDRLTTARSASPKRSKPRTRQTPQTPATSTRPRSAKKNWASPTGSRRAHPPSSFSSARSRAIC